MSSDTIRRPASSIYCENPRTRSRARWLERVVAYGRVAAEPTVLAPPLGAGPEGTGVNSSPHAWSWAALLHRAFAIDVLACAHCGCHRRLFRTPYVLGRVR